MTDRIAALQAEVSRIAQRLADDIADDASGWPRHSTAWDDHVPGLIAAAEALGRAKAEREWAERMRVKPLDAIAARETACDG